MLLLHGRFIWRVGGRLEEPIRSFSLAFLLFVEPIAARDNYTSGFVVLCSSSSLLCGTIAPLHTCGKQGGKGKGRQLWTSAVRQVEQCPSLQHSTTLATNIFTPHDCFLLNIAKMPSMPFLIETKVIEVCCAAGGEFTTGPFTLQVPLSLALARLCNSRRRRENQFPLLFWKPRCRPARVGERLSALLTVEQWINKRTELLSMTTLSRDKSSGNRINLGN